MAPPEQIGESKKRKREAHRPEGARKPAAKASGKHPMSSKSKSFKPSNPKKSVALPPKKAPETPRERRLAAKEMAEARKKRRKANYSLEKELTSLWEKMRRSLTKEKTRGRLDFGKKERSELISAALGKMRGKILEIASSHVSARVLQTCVKHCSTSERDAVFEELRPHLLTLSQNKYAVHLVKKLLAKASKSQLEWFISSLHGRVAALLRHSVGSAVVEQAFQLGNASQRQSLLMEMYSTELQLFKDLTRTNAGGLVDVISKLGLQKTSVLQHMNSVFQPILEKGLLDYSIIHSALVEFFTIADRSSATDILHQLVPLLVQESCAIDEDEQFPAQHLQKDRKRKRIRTPVPLIVRMMRTGDGLKVAVLCVKYGNAKERKKILKGIKKHIRKLAFDDHGSLLLSCILSVVDDTKLMTKIVIHEMQTMLKELILDKYGRRAILELLHPQWRCNLGPKDLACLNIMVQSLCVQSDDDADATVNSNSDRQTSHSDDVMVDSSDAGGSSKGLQSAPGSKKDPSLRRHELLVESGLAEALIEHCIENVGDILRSNIGKFGREMIYEVSVGGANNILHPLADKVASLHEAIASLAALPRSEGSGEEHIFDNFHSSRAIKKLIVDCPAFGTILWRKALEGKCEMWAQGHSYKVVSAYLASADPLVTEMAKSELQPLEDRGLLKRPEHNKQVKKKEG